jgi:hypothetical protein
MADETKRTSPPVNVHLPKADTAGKRVDQPIIRRGSRRSAQELEPIAHQVAQNAELMERLRKARGSKDQALGSQVMDEITRHAQSLDPTITFSDATRIFVILIKMN